MAEQVAAEERSLEEMEEDRWGEPPADATRLIATIHRLRKEPIRALTAEDLRVLIGEHVGVDVPLPFALDWLAQDPLLEGDFYPGDVLVSVLVCRRTIGPLTSINWLPLTEFSPS